METITVVGGGFAGLVAAITSAEAGARVRLLEAHRTLGGRARATAPPYVAHDGPHVLYGDGPWWRWLAHRDLIGAHTAMPLRGLAGFRFRHGGRLRRTPPAALLPILTRRRRRSPVDQDFRTWMREQHGDAVAAAASMLMGVATFDADPGRLSAAFVWPRLRRVTAPIPAARYVLGGWNGLVDRLADHARALGVTIETGARVTELPAPPVVVATSLDAASTLLGAPLLPRVESGRTLLFDVAVRVARREPFVVSDLDQAGWLERYTLPDPGLAPRGESLFQAQLPLHHDETKADGTVRLQAFVDDALPGWRERVTWQRDAIANRRTGALDLPGHTWRDRPAIDRGDGVFLAGDQVAAPGLLSEVSYASGVAAAELALGRPAGVAW
ncbi:FAD-dependent oxidoreductase [Cryptosporangium arvum]|uniref:FAD-dependent oxidoreductase n=1 Tax=Cryptosporangium arvum TaxID=80871 RepID=UPI0004BCDF72|nr:FAD-dependent oxidoreductase [Cryptosporangium arvum]